MRKAIATALVIFAMAGQVAATDKYGVLAKSFLEMTTREKMIYAAGVADALWEAGVRCPAPVPSYGEIISMAETQIWRSYAKAEEVWAATAIMAAMYDRGCKRQ